MIGWTARVLLAVATLGCCPLATASSYSSLLGADPRARLIQLAPAADAQVWVVLQRSAGAGTPVLPGCATHSDCSVLERVDPAQDRISRRVVLQGLRVEQLRPLDDGRLLLFGNANPGTALPHDPAQLWASTAGEGPWLGLLGTDDAPERGAFIGDRHLRGLHLLPDGDALLVAARHQLGNFCADINPGCSRTRLARISADLTQLRYDVEPLQGFQNLPLASTVGDNGLLYLSLGGHLESMAAAPFPTGLQESVWEPVYSVGALAVIELQQGQLQHATYTRTQPATAIAYDPLRNGAWLLARSSTGNLPASPDALQPGCGAGAGCGPIVPPLNCGAAVCVERSDATLSLFSSDGSRLRHASYLGLSETARALAALHSAGRTLFLASAQAAGTPLTPGHPHWLLVPAQAGPQRIPAPRPAMVPALAGEVQVVPGRPGEIWLAAAHVSDATSSPPQSLLLGSSGLDPACLQAGNDCIRLLRMLMPTGTPTPAIPLSTLSAPAIATLLLLLVLLASRSALLQRD